MTYYGAIKEMETTGKLRWGLRRSRWRPGCFLWGYEDHSLDYVDEKGRSDTFGSLTKKDARAVDWEIVDPKLYRPTSPQP